MRLVFPALFAAAALLHAESGADAWLRYAPPTQKPIGLPAVVSMLGDAEVEASARAEIIRGMRGMTDRILRAETGLPKESAIVIGTFEEFKKTAPQLHMDATLGEDSFWLKTVTAGTVKYTVIAGPKARGALYGTFALLRKIALSEPVAALDEKQTPYAPTRWVNEWANLDGTTERGYAGLSPFWSGLKSREDLTRAGGYGRLLASLGIQACAITSVNANVRVLTPEFIPHIARVAAALRPWGVRAAIAVSFGSPKTMGGLDTFDPADPKVIAWWKAKFDEIYQAVPDLAGVVLKADSEGRVGPSAYGRTHADAANVVARALAPHSGILFYRGFVYDNHMDWNNLKNDRGRAAYDNFHDLDGKFDDNVIIQIKNGPIDFQVREPASPLFGGLEKTNEAIELQITQEYFGQARHTVYLVPYWKETLDFDMHAKGAGTPVKALAAGKVFKRPLGGFVGVSNVGLDDNWTANHLSQANLYGFGRLAWNPDLTSKQINDEWTRLTFGDDPKVDETVSHIQMTSWRTYENYTGPLGLQTLTDIVGDHYGVNVEASERNGWGQWHRADNKGVGMDRTVATGTGFIGQYRPEVAKILESLATCPDDLLLFLHHVPYTYKLHDSKTVIQYIYDSHYEGAAVAGYVREWKALAGQVDERRYKEVLAQLEYQAGQAVVWRDAVDTWFQTASGIADAKGRVGHEPGRIEAESMSLDGYTVRDIKPVPAEDASGGKLISCAAAKCTATHRYDGAAGRFDLNVEYFDQTSGALTFQVFVGDQLMDEWKADLNVTGRTRAVRIDSTSSTRRVIRGVALRPGDNIRIVGTPDGREPAAVDYIEIKRQ